MQRDSFALAMQFSIGRRQCSFNGFNRLLIYDHGLSLIEPRTVSDINNGWSFWHAPNSRNRGKVQKKERKKERTNETNETFCSYPTTKRRRLGTSPQAASSAQLLHTTTTPTPFSTVYPCFFETRPSLVSRLENSIIQTQRASSSKLVETDPVFVADGHEVCRVVLLRELCKCRT